MGATFNFPALGIVNAIVEGNFVVVDDPRTGKPIKIKIEDFLNSAIARGLVGAPSVSTPDEVVEFDQLTPTTGGVVFTPNTPATEGILYVSSVDASTWIYESGVYVTKVITTSPSTPFYLTGTTIDAGGNKTAAVHHNGPLRANELQIGSAYKLPTAAPATGKVLGYVSPGVVGWITVANGGLVSVTPHDNGVAVYYATVDLAFAASTPGDLITVFPGTYSTTTTAANGLLKDGVNWFFHPGTLLTKSTSGPLFRNNAFTSGANVYGYGKFQTSNVATNVYLIEGDRQNVSTVFEAYSAVSSTTHTIRTNCTAGTYTYLNVNKIKIDNCTSSNGAAFYSSGTGTQIDIDFGNCQSTSTYAIYIVSPGVVGRIKTINVKSSTTTAVYCEYTSYASRIAFNGVSYIPGGSGLSFWVDGDSYANTSYFSIDAPSGMADIIASGNNVMTISVQAGAAVNSSILWSKATLNGSATGWNSGSLSGSAVYLDLQGGTFSGEVTGALVQSGGKFEGVCRYSGRGDFSGATISGGTTVFTDFGHIYGKLTVSGGDVTLHNYYTSVAGNQGASYNGAIALTSGTLRVVGMIKNLNTANSGGIYPCIDWTGGTLILHSSAAFYCGSSDSAAIKATGSMTGKIYGNVVSNTTDTGTITWQVGTVANRIVDTNVR